MLQQCSDRECKVCKGDLVQNPYGYLPNKCQNDYLKVVCTTNPAPETKKKGAPSFLSIDRSCASTVASCRWH
jgi:hypothetical protein